MNRLLRFVASSFLVGSSFTCLWACSGSGGSGGSDDPFAPPAGCTRTQCDVDRDSCTGEQQSQCSECESLCDSPYADSSCFETCANICDDPSRSSNCEDEYTSCQQTKENTECVSPASATANDAGSDGGVRADGSAANTGVDSGSRADAGADSSPAASVGASCQIADPGVLRDTPPSGQSSGACTAGEIAAVSAQVDAAGATLRAAIGQTSTSCQACALSQVTDAAWGAFVEITPADLMLNQGACVSQIDATCGAEVNALFFCVNEACSTCTDASSYASCSSTAMSGFCADYAVDSSCLAETTSGDAAQCFPGAATDVQLAQTILTLQCGSM